MAEAARRPEESCPESQSKSKPGARGLLKLITAAASEWSADNALRLGAAVSYYTVFSLGPVLVLSIQIAALCFGEQAARGELAGQLSQLVGADGAQAVEAMLAHARKPASGALPSILGLIVLLFGATGAFVELQSALDSIWKAAARPAAGIRGFVVNRLLSFAMVLSIGFLLLVSLVLSTVLTALGQYFEHLFGASLTWLHLISSGITFVLITVLFALIFKILPNVRLEWRDVWVGAALTSLLFSVGKFLIGLYLGRSALSSAYGASASLVIVMLWTYYSSLILFYGAEFTKAFARQYGSHCPAR
jgi:membrane protein